MRIIVIVVIVVVVVAVIVVIVNVNVKLNALIMQLSAWATDASACPGVKSGRESAKGALYSSSAFMHVY